MKIALIEDRISRLKTFTDVDLANNSLIEIISGITLTALKANINEGNFADLEHFNCIISHRSALDIQQRDFLKSYCMMSKKPLIFFSGGLSSSIYNDSMFPYLNMRANDFYSRNLLAFIDDTLYTGEINLLVLQFGNKWRLNRLLGLRANLNLKIQLHFNNLCDSILVDDLQMDTIIKTDLTSRFKLLWLEDNLHDLSEDELHQLLINLNELIYEEVINT